MNAFSADHNGSSNNVIWLNLPFLSSSILLKIEEDDVGGLMQ